MYVSGVEVPDYWPCPKCGYTWSEPTKTYTTTETDGKKTIEVTYKCRNCNSEYTKRVYWEE